MLLEHRVYADSSTLGIEWSLSYHMTPERVQLGSGVRGEMKMDWWRTQWEDYRWLYLIACFSFCILWVFWERVSDNEWRVAKTNWCDVEENRNVGMSEHFFWVSQLRNPSIIKKVIWWIILINITFLGCILRSTSSQLQQYFIIINSTPSFILIYFYHPFTYSTPQYQHSAPSITFLQTINYTINYIYLQSHYLKYNESIIFMAIVLFYE